MDISINFTKEELELIINSLEANMVNCEHRKDVIKISNISKRLYTVAEAIAN